MRTVVCFYMTAKERAKTVSSGKKLFHDTFSILKRTFRKDSSHVTSCVENEGAFIPDDLIGNIHRVITLMVSTRARAFAKQKLVSTTVIWLID